MKEYNYQFRILLTFIIMLSLGMLIQSVLIFFINVRHSVKTDVQFSVQSLEQKASWIGQTYTYKGKSLWLSVTGVEKIRLYDDQYFNCEYIYFTAGDFALNSTCSYLDSIKNISREVIEKDIQIVRYMKNDLLSSMHKADTAIIGIPLADNEGNVVGSIVAERSLQPIYQSLEREVTLVLCYFMVNLFLFSILFFFRIKKLIFKPLEILVHKADSYQPDDTTYFVLPENQSPFRKISSSLNSFLDRIERDNHSLRQHVKDLESLNAELQEKNELVLRSEKLATVGVLSAGLAHEIGNPLSIVQGYVDLLRRHDLDHDEKIEFTQKAQDELNRIKRLILQLLDYSRADSLAEVGNFSICEVIESVVEFVSFEKQLSHCSIQTAYPNGDQYIVCSDDHLKQVLVNCLLNAADATSEIQDKKRTIIITASVLKENGKESSLCIDIVDNGSGVNEEHLSSLFDPFFTTKDIGKGTGLGLFVSYMIMEKMGGSITLNNAEEGGAVVRLTLPLKK